MKRKQIIIGTLAILILGIFAAVVFAQGMGDDNEQMWKKAGLDDEQIETLKAEKMDFQKKQVQLQADIKILGLELKEMMDVAKPDKNAIHAKVKAIGALRTEMQLARVDWMLKFKEVTTEEQQEKLKELRQEKKAGNKENRFGGKRGKGMR